MWPWRVNMPTQYLLRLLLLMLRNLLTTVWCRFGSWSFVVEMNLCSDYEHKVWLRFWNWSFGEILKLKLSQCFAADVWLRLWSWILVEILVVDACLRRWNLVKICERTCDMNSTLGYWGSVWEWFCIFVGVFIFIFVSLSSTLSPIFLTQFPLVLCESDTPNWQRASHTNDSIWRPYLLSNKCPCLWS